jgi:GTPase
VRPLNGYVTVVSGVLYRLIGETALSQRKRSELSVKQERAILVGVILPKSTADPRDPLGELNSLAKTAGAKVVGQILQKRQRVDSGTYVGSGKVQEIAELCKVQKANVVVFDNDLSPGQIGSIETTINLALNSPRDAGVKVLDRSELILDIFATRARSSEAKLQVELAQMEYTYPRLTRMWGHLERIASGTTAGIGARGPGEMQLEIDRRLVRKRISILRDEIAKVQARKTRTVQKRKTDNFTVCLVGYTNAGKSTLFNTLTAAGTEVDDRLFSTLDTKTRAWKLDRANQVLLSDTVGFVRDLPHNLVASFKATLEEAVHADLLLHVLDVGHERARQQYDAVLKVLEEIGVGDKPQILLLNKIDTDEGEANYPTWRTLYPESIPLSARSGTGASKLYDAVARHVSGLQVEAVLEADAGNGRLISFIERKTQVQEREFLDGRVRMKVIVGRQTLEDLQRNEQVRIEMQNEER